MSLRKSGFGHGYSESEKSEFEVRYSNFGEALVASMDKDSTESDRSRRHGSMAKFKQEHYLVRFAMRLSYSLAHMSDVVVTELADMFRTITEDVFRFRFKDVRRKKGRDSGRLITHYMLAIIAKVVIVSVSRASAATAANDAREFVINRGVREEMINLAVLLIDMCNNVVQPRYICDKYGYGLFYTTAAMNEKELNIISGDRLASSVQLSIQSAATQVSGYGEGGVGIVSLPYFCNSISDSDSDDCINIEVSSVDEVIVPLCDMGSNLGDTNSMTLTMNCITSVRSNPCRSTELRWKYNHGIRNARMLKAEEKK
jgi:hypothetical protein